MIFALERNKSALSLLAGKKTATGFCVHHFDQRPLLRQTSCLQEMFNASPEPVNDVIVGVHDDDLILRHILVPKNIAKIYPYCQKQLAQVCSIKDYSWDAYPISCFKDEGHLLLCAAYPLEKIIFLQELLKLSNVRMRALEPSACAIARMSFVLLKQTNAEYALEDTLMTVEHGEVLALEQIRSFERAPVNLSSYIQTVHPYRLPSEAESLFAPLGLALRSDHP
ncbi:MAG: hypothetical protein WC748_00665 [Legionellales bacterium]|jgi:hypothetical protein